MVPSKLFYYKKADVSFALFFAGNEPIQGQLTCGCCSPFGGGTRELRYYWKEEVDQGILFLPETQESDFFLLC